MTKEPTKHTMTCGCVVSVENLNVQKGVDISYCSTHAEAPEMLKTLKHLLRTQVVDITMVMQAIAKAEGRTSEGSKGP